MIAAAAACRYSCQYPACQYHHQHKYKYSGNTARHDIAIVLYPFLAGLAAHLDRTNLHSLASTCHSVHAALSDYRPTLLACSLRCAYPLRLRL